VKHHRCLYLFLMPSYRILTCKLKFYLFVSCPFMLVIDNQIKSYDICFFRYLARKHLVDVTEIFRQLSGEKKYRMIKLAFYFCLFIITIYRFDFCYISINILGNRNTICIHLLANSDISYSKTSEDIIKPL
jgi:hypothetical protein